MRFMPKWVRGPTCWQWAVLATITFVFLSRAPVISFPAHLSPGEPARPYLLGPQAYQLWCESRAIYGCDPQQLDQRQLTYVKRACRFVSVFDKYATLGLDSLSDDECQFVVDFLPTHYPCHDEIPLYERILRACRERLAGDSEVSEAAD
jgi:hypothetical protein